MANRWLELLKEDNAIHNTAAALREAPKGGKPGPAEKPKTPTNLTDKTDKIPDGHDVEAENPDTRINGTDKTDKKPSAAGRLGLAVTWSGEFVYISMHDPNTGEWHDLQTKGAPGWAVWEARKRKELHKGGNRRAYRLTSREMEEIWEQDQIAPEEGIIEEYPVEEG